MWRWIGAVSVLVWGGWMGWGSTGCHPMQPAQQENNTGPGDAGAIVDTGGDEADHVTERVGEQDSASLPDVSTSDSLRPEASITPDTGPSSDGSGSSESHDPPPPDFDTTTLLKPKAPTHHTFETTHFSGSGNCSMCHDGLRDNQGNDVSIVKAWSSTMMANSARDPLWQAKMRSELSRLPQYSELIQDKCTRCHAPMANHESKVQKKTIRALDGGILDPNNPLYHAAMAGVSCTLCHQIQKGADFGTPTAMSGKYKLPTYTSATQQRVLYGPYDNLFPNPMEQNVSFTPTFSSHISDSKLCASCHNLKTPFVDKDGKVVPQTPAQEFPEQMIYAEWERSQYARAATAQSCQSCHMPRAQGVPLSTRPRWLPRRNNFAQHIFVGANVFMLTMLKSNRNVLGITANNFDFTIQQAKAMLRTAARLQVVEKSFQKGELVLKLKVTNLSGHKLPTGFPSRRVYLHLTVTDTANRVVFESGKAGPNGRIVGANADDNPSQWEPHHDEITSPDQVQIYEAVMETPEKQITYTLLRAASYRKDNRLLPLGFAKANAPRDVQVAGQAVQDNNFEQGSDIVTYRISGLSVVPHKVQIELNYQTLGYRFAQDLFRDNRHQEVRLFQYLWLNAPSYHETIASTSLSVSP